MQDADAVGACERDPACVALAALTIGGVLSRGHVLRRRRLLHRHAATTERVRTLMASERSIQAALAEQPLSPLLLGLQLLIRRDLDQAERALSGLVQQASRLGPPAMAAAARAEPHSTR